MENRIIDIYSKGEYPANILSNFYPNKFIFDGIECASMEGFLQSLKVKNAKKQEQMCSLIGIEAKKIGKYRFIWKVTGSVYWRGKKYKRDSFEFRDLIKKAYDAMYKENGGFREALLATKGKELKHSIGKHNPRKTILTEEEFVGCLNALRNEYDLKEQGCK